MSHEDSPTGQQFCVRYDYTYFNGTTHTLWGLVHTHRTAAEVEKRRHEKDGHPAKIFIRDLTPWREDGVPVLCVCGHDGPTHSGFDDSWCEAEACKCLRWSAAGSSYRRL